MADDFFSRKAARLGNGFEKSVFPTADRKKGEHILRHIEGCAGVLIVRRVKTGIRDQAKRTVYVDEALFKAALGFHHHAACGRKRTVKP